MKFPNHLIRRPKLTGFTLIELLVVIIIIAALAALVVPNVGMFGRSTDMAVSAKSQADVANQIQLFFVTQKRYPAGLDSLITTAASTPPNAIYGADTDDAETQTIGLPYSGSDGSKLGNTVAATSAGTPPVAVPATPAALTTFTVPANNSATGVEWLKSISRAGLDTVYDHSTAVLNSNVSNTTLRTIASTTNVAELTGAKLLAKLHPQPLLPTEKIIAFGYGQKSAAIGKTTTNCPLYPGADKTYYGRYIVYFKIYASGERATLVGVSDAYGRTPDYTGQQFNESLPDGARQG